MKAFEFTMTIRKFDYGWFILVKSLGVEVLWVDIVRAVGVVV